MGNEENSNSSRHKILTNKTTFEESNLRDIDNSDSEKVQNENENNNFENEESNSSLSDNSIENNNNEIEYIFKWEEKCNTAKIIGSFNNWKNKLEMEKDPKDNLYKYKIKLKKNKYEYKFIIDNNWKYSTHQPTINDGKGNINNFLDLTNINIKNSFKKKPNKKKPKKKLDIYNIKFPNKEELNTEAPIAQELFLKSFYINDATNQNIIGEKQYLKYFNKESFTEEKSYRNIFFSPHVNLNHTLKFCEKNKNILQVGSSYRFRNKNCTIVYYSKIK